ncbi:protoporphyrinogen oxidase [Corynebacterium choanae]|uniref:Coproporphyrinogen III oxidase n=1 Tax=Corynebacterium choanae TaxID=1862358 RepID=A0A3G6JEA7_9CORY|nr:protoporphyrinogen oxidase [Corynebacterium choanae]AZA14474.1 Protoporphyrinogen oxidase [Corynebacterium choanae]
MKYAVIGAGLAGLVAAKEITDRDPAATIDVFEADERIGGKLLTVPFQTGPVDVGAEAYLAFREDAVEYFTDLGLADAMVSPSTAGSLIYSGGKLHPMPQQTMMGIPSASAALGGLVDEHTAAQIDSEAQRDPIDWQIGQDCSVGQLVRDRFGEQVVEHVVCAFLGGVYSAHADDLGLRATVPQLAKAFDTLVEQGKPVTLTAGCKLVDEMRRASSTQQTHTTPQTRPVFGSFTGGYTMVYEALADAIRGDIYLDTFITGIRVDGEQYVLQGAPTDGRYDRLLVATPAPMTASLLKQVAPAAVEHIRQIQLASSVVVAMRFATGAGLPNNSGILVATDEPLHAKAFTFSSMKWPHLGQRDGVLVRASFGRLGDTTALQVDEDTLVDWALADLQTMTGFDGVADGVEEIFVQRWFGGIPQYGPGHGEIVAAALAELAELPGVAVTGAWVHGVGVPAVIADARAAADRLIDQQ